MIELAAYMKQYRLLYDGTIWSVADSISPQIALV